MAYDIWIEAETWDEQWDENDCNSDVIVTFDSSSKWIATFFTYKNIVTLSNEYEKTGECLNGLYFSATDIILIKTLNREAIENTICDLLQNNLFEKIFSRIDKHIPN